MTTAAFYGNYFVSSANKEVDLNSDVIKVALVTSAYTPNQDTDQYFDVSVVADEASGTGYTAGGATVSGPTITVIGASNTFKFADNGSNISWPSNTATARYAVVYDSTPATNKPLICYFDFGADKIPTALTFDATNGIATVTYT